MIPLADLQKTAESRVEEGRAQVLKSFRYIFENGLRVNCREIGETFEQIAGDEYVSVFAKLVHGWENHAGGTDILTVVVCSTNDIRLDNDVLNQATDGRTFHIYTWSAARHKSDRCHNRGVMFFVPKAAPRMYIVESTDFDEHMLRERINADRQA